MLVFESPGYRGRIKDNQMKNLESQRSEAVRQGSVDQIIDVSKKSFHQYWIQGIQRNFFERLFETLKKGNVIDFEDVNSYIGERKYWQDFFITDAALCPGERKVLHDAAKECREYLSSQISIANPNLIIPFGNEALGSLMELTGDPQACLPNQPRSFRVTDCHGYLLQYKRFQILPLVHLSRQYMTLRESYFDYLLEGLRLISLGRS